MTRKLRRFLDQVRPETPYLVVDVDLVEANYRTFAEALDGVRIFYAVKANPAPEILARLAALGSSFDVASPLGRSATGMPSRTALSKSDDVQPRMSQHCFLLTAKPRDDGIKANSRRNP
jgi:hypothetical protein